MKWKLKRGQFPAKSTVMCVCVDCGFFAFGWVGFQSNLIKEFDQRWRIVTLVLMKSIDISEL